MKRLKKILKWAGVSLLVLIALVVIAGYFMHEPIPKEVQGDAEHLTSKIEKAINKVAWDSTVAISWTFAGMHHYVWDKKHHRVKTTVDEHIVYFNTQTLDGAVYTKNSMKVFGDEANQLIEKAWKNFANDSFWMIAPYKLRDPGTERSLVVVEGDTCLKVTYTSGGVTPGDSYVWLLDENYVPMKWKLWVSIIPVGGIGYGWNDWQVTETGAKIATNHQGLFDIKITNLKTGMSINEVSDEANFEDQTLQ